MAAKAPNIAIIGLEPRDTAAPVVSGTPPVAVAELAGLPVPEVERVADEMVLLRPIDELTEPDAVGEAVTEVIVDSLVSVVERAVVVDEASEEEALEDESADDESAEDEGAEDEVAEGEAVDVASLPERLTGPMKFARSPCLISSA